MPEPTYIVRRRTDGSIRVMRSDGEDCTSVEAVWLGAIITQKLREQALSDTFRELEAKTEGITPGGEKFDVDPLIFAFEAERERQNVSRRALARAIYCSNESKLGAYVRGRSRPHMDVLRAWAYVLGLDILAIPRSLTPKVGELLKGWQPNQPELVKVEVEE